MVTITGLRHTDAVPPGRHRLRSALCDDHDIDGQQETRQERQPLPSIDVRAIKMIDGMITRPEKVPLPLDRPPIIVTWYAAPLVGQCKTADERDDPVSHPNEGETPGSLAVSKRIGPDGHRG